MLQVTPISEDDYFAKNPEFSAWLRDLQHIHFNELTAEASRDKFKVHAVISGHPDCVVHLNNCLCMPFIPKCDKRITFRIEGTWVRC